MPYKDYEKQKESSRLNYYANKERKLAQAKAYYYENWDAKQEYRKKWIEANKEKFIASKKKYFAKRNSDPATTQKNRAYNKIKWAIHTGKLTKQPCQICGITKVEAHHHKGYSDKYALDVEWFCRKHHERKHHDIKNDIKRFTRP